MSRLERVKRGAQKAYRTFRLDHGRERIQEDSVTSAELAQVVAEAEGEVSLTDRRYHDELVYTYMKPDEAVHCFRDVFDDDEAGEVSLTYTYDRVDREIEFSIRERVDPDDLAEDCWYRDMLEAADEDRPVRYIMHGTIETNASEDDLLKLV